MSYSLPSHRKTEKLLAVGKCLKKDGWIISVYQRMTDRCETIKIKRVVEPSKKFRSFSSTKGS